MGSAVFALVMSELFTSLALCIGNILRPRQCRGRLGFGMGLPYRTCRI